MRRVLKTRQFARWLRKTDLTDQILCAAIFELEKGLIDADLGGGLIKIRVPLPGRGKSGGARTLLATNKIDRWFFVFGFEKNDKTNIKKEELEALQHLAWDLLNLSSVQIDESIEHNILQEICYGC